MFNLRRGLASLIVGVMFIVVIGNMFFAVAEDKVFLDEKYYPANFTTCAKEPGYTDWERLGWLKLTEIQTGGVHFEMVKCVQNVRYGVVRPVDANGLHIVYDNYTKQDGAEGFFTITLSVHCFNSDYLPDLVANAYGYLPFVLILDSVNGNLIARSSQSFSAASPEIPQTVLVSNNDNLKYAAIKDKPWDVRFKKVNANNYSVTVNGVTANIPLSVILGKESTLDLSACYAVFGTWANNNTMSYDVMSVHSGNEVCADEIAAADLQKATKVIDTIKNIGAIRAISEPAIKSARSGYTALLAKFKGLVYNLNILVTAETVYPTVKAIADIGKVTLNSEAAINKALGLYAVLSAENKQLVSNWKVMTAAQSELIRLKSLAGDYIKVTTTTAYVYTSEATGSTSASTTLTSTSTGNSTESTTITATTTKTPDKATSGKPSNANMLIILLSGLGVLVGVGVVLSVLFLKSKNKLTN